MKKVSEPFTCCGIYSIFISMSAILSHSGKLLFGAVATGGILYLSLMTFEGWLRHSTDIFLATVQNGIAWCF
ncbi:hypothetical protein G6L28_09410 [Agrobacterium larrymoorei]|uniref:hypothetical protein n=1 Tax=Agrobacterium larrymoorei TaxID=160699 RepID=UPI00157311FA|nr:hypothetical protein [Agrobacterium larrymoorei]NTJ42809.1 hypothetical protein [Agrobacterium larrymoorei]